MLELAAQVGHLQSRETAVDCGFDKYVCDGDTITGERYGFTFTATIHRDYSSDAPWDNSDLHGPVSEWTTRDKQPGERVLSSDRNSHRFYDFAEAVAIAKRDGWDAKPYGQGSKGERAARAAEADFEALRAWCNDEWHYVGVAVVVSKADVELTGDFDHALWGIEANYPESDNSYLTATAEEHVSEALEAARAKLEDLKAA